MKGHVHSLESFGTVDGPGTRFVVFVQGCPMRCKYCHNPDTWNPSGGTLMDTDEIMEAFLRNAPFYKNGGMTVTGGEPMMQMDFVTELFKKCKESGHNTCLDTSGIVFKRNNPEVLKKVDALLAVTDLVMLDIKHIDPEEHLKLTKQKNDDILDFAHYLDEKHVDVWIRHVVVPGITFDEGFLKRLGKFIATLHNVKALDVLPYHTMGEVKYEQLGMDYPLKGVPQLDRSEAIKARNIIIDAMRKERALLAEEGKALSKSPEIISED